MRNVGIEYPAAGQMCFYDLGNPPSIGENSILLRTEYSGLTNGTERHSLLGEHGWKGAFPSRNGYQHVGTIEAIGPAVKGFAVGDRIFFGHYVGHRGWHVVDVSATDPSSNASHLCIHLPPDVDHRHCALLGVAGVAMRGVRRFRVAPGQNVWVLGGGPIGQFAAQCARAVGALVTVSEVDDRRLRVAGELGAHRLVNARDDDAFARLKDGGPYECIIDTSGLPSLFHDIRKHGLLRHGGVIGALAVRSDAVFPWSLLHGHEASIEVSCHFSLDDLRLLLHFMRQGIIRVEPLVSHTVSIDEAPRIYEILRDRPQELLGVIFDWV